MPKKRMRMFAGPNGSGKSILFDQLRSNNIPLGPLVNADIIQQQLLKSNQISLREYNLKGITQSTWKKMISELADLNSRIQRMNRTPQITIQDDLLYLPKNQVTSYTSALIADFLRFCLVDQGVDFSFETVMSHQSKVNFLTYCKSYGYITYLYYVATDGVEINIQRVANRVAKGGHNVPEVKIRDRYEKSLALLYSALKEADRAFLLDNSGEEARYLVLEKKLNGNAYLLVEPTPIWYNTYIQNKLNKSVKDV